MGVGAAAGDDSLVKGGGEQGDGGECEHDGRAIAK